MELTGERVIVEKMNKDSHVLIDHLARYNFAKKIVKDKTVLDASCGSGYGSDMLLKEAKSVDGVDNSKEAINYCKKKFKKCNFRIVDLNNKFTTKKYNVIVSFETIEHLSKPRFFLNNIKDNCNKFIFSIPINNQGKFHKRVYSVDDIKFLMYDIFKDWHIEWFGQKRKGEIKRLINFKTVDYVIGIANKII